MNAKPLIVGALLLAPVIGAVAGQGMSTEPIMSATDLSATLPQTPAIAMGDAATRTTPRLPDHYAMETPEGRVDVDELAMRGRYANLYEPYQHWQPEVDENLTMLDARWDDEALDARAERALSPQATRHAQATTQSGQRPRGVARLTAMDNARTGEMAQAEAMPQNVKAPTAEPQIANMRVINVREALANKN